METHEYKDIVARLLKRHYLIDIEKTPLRHDQEIEKHMGTSEPFEIVSSFAKERGLVRLDSHGFPSIFEQGNLTIADQSAITPS